MTTTNSQRITRLMAAHEAMVPYWKDGAFNDAPAALASEYADALLGAPASYWAAVDRLDPSVAPAMIAWAQGHVERRDYPEFFAMLAELERIRGEQGDEAAAAPEHAELFLKMMDAAPPRYWDDAGAEGDYALIVNATSASREGTREFSLPFDLANPRTLAVDLNYGEAAIPFLAWARAAKCRDVVDGLGMLVEQAAASFELWHGVRPDTAPVYATLRDKDAALVTAD